MARTIAQRITLEGGTEFRQALSLLASSAQQTFNSLSQSVDAVSSAATRLAPTLDQVQRKFNEIKSQSKQVAENFNTTGERFRTVGTRLAILTALVVGANGGFIALVKNAGAAAEEITNAAAAAGLSARNYQLMATGFEAAGIEATQFQQLMARMNRSFGDNIKAAEAVERQQKELNDEFLAGKTSGAEYLTSLNKITTKTNEATDVFTRLGVTAKSAGNDPREAFLQLVDAFSRLPDGIEKSSLQMEIFGRNGAKVAAIANQGRDAYLAYEQQLERLIPPLTKLQLKIGNDLDAAFDNVILTAKRASLQFALTFGPSTTTLLNAVAEAIARNRGVLLQLAQAVVTAFDPLIKKAVEFVNAFTLDPNFFSGLSESLASFAGDVVQAVNLMVSAWNGFVAVLQVVADGINALFGTDLSGRALAFIAVIGTFTGIFSALASTITLVVSVVGLLVTALGGPLTAAIIAVGLLIGFVLGQGLIDAVNAIPGLIASVSQALIDGFNGTVANFKLIWEGAINFITDKWTSFKDLVLSGIRAITDAARSIGSIFGGGDSNNNQNNFAGGGRVRGPGTSTSDSIPAWLSTGEYVVKAKAVSHYGTRLLDAINSMQLKVPSPEFALGGLVHAFDAILPRQKFADGGLVAAPASPTGRPVILKIGGETFGPFSGPEDAVSSLERFATGKSIRSAGRKPTWT